MSQYYGAISTAKAIKTSRETCALRRPDGTEWTVEELIAMQFAYIKDLAEKESKEKISEAVVTVSCGSRRVAWKFTTSTRRSRRFTPNSRDKRSWTPWKLPDFVP